MSRHLPLYDTPVLYGRITRILHWSIAALIILQFFGMSLKLILGRQPVVGFFVSLHQPVGTILFVLITLRIFWAIINRNNRPAHGHGMIGVASRVGHLLLYLFMLTVPALALLRAYASDKSFAPFGFQIFPAQQPPVAWAESLATQFHGEMAWIMGVMILGHVLMVAVHQAMWRDGTLQRMAGDNRRD